MKISVIIPTYKPQEYIWECLYSLKKQTFEKREFEIILILNGCNEPYKTQISDFIKSEMDGFQVKFVQTDVPGVSNARNIGLDCAQGEYITFLDDDDFVSPSFFESLYAKSSFDTLALSNAIAVKNDRVIDDGSYKLTQIYRSECVKGKRPFYLVTKYFSGPCMKLIHRDIIGTRRFNPTFKVGEDCLFMFLISDQIRYIDFVEKDAIYFRRIRGGSAMTSFTYKEKVANFLKIVPVYSKIFFKGFPRYNVIFYVTRLLGAIHSIL